MTFQNDLVRADPCEQQKAGQLLNARFSAALSGVKMRFAFASISEA
jgi:hypothetical protein